MKHERDKQAKALVIPLFPQRDYNLSCGAAFGWRAHVDWCFPRLTDTVPREASSLQDTSAVVALSESATLLRCRALFATRFPAASVPFLARQLEAGVKKKGRERSAPLEERVNGGECTLLCIRGQYEWNA